MYQVDDLSLINYYMTSAKSELWNPGAPGRAIKYVSELNEITEGANVSYGMSVAAGQQDDSLMFEYAYGGLIVFYNGYAYGQKQEGVYLKRVLYIPQSTENTKEAYVAAAQKRINDYLGNNDVIVSYGGTISSLDSDAEDPQLPVITDDGNYYNIKIKGRTYKFYIIKGTSDKLKPPIYNAKNLDSNITVTSKDSSIPLDTTINVKLVENKNIKDKIGTDNYITYDINLYSNAKEASIEKITNDLFEVSIPVPERLNNKSLIVYYETNEGKLEEHEVTVKNCLAVFTTDHFSKYTLAEKTNAKAETLEKNPQTYDGIMKWVALGSISIFGIVGTVVYVKKHNI
ncbi:MAG: hypothetical protein PUD59_04345 [bacterium]|nr:hypothetical protein [bacterium]